MNVNIKKGMVHVANTSRYIIQLNSLYNQWNDIYNNGSTTLWYPDGWLCNQLRVKILELKKQLEESCINPSEYEVYARKNPIELPNNKIFNGRKLLHNGIRVEDNFQYQKKSSEGQESYDQMNLDLGIHRY